LKCFDGVSSFKDRGQTPPWNGGWGDGCFIILRWPSYSYAALNKIKIAPSDSVVANERQSMKKLILAAMILGLAGTGVQTAKAGDREWAVVGKVLTGITAAAVITTPWRRNRPGFYRIPAPRRPVVIARRPPPSGVVYVQTALRRWWCIARRCVVPAPGLLCAGAGGEFPFGGGYHRFHHDRW